MKPSEIVFDKNYCMYGIVIDGQMDPVTLSISDELEAAYELLRDDYKDKIAGFVNSSGKWFPIACEKIISEVDNTDGLRLMTIYVLFEQSQSDSLFGLLFNLEFDREHGRGMMLNGESFEILKYGDASVAFEGM